VLAPFASAASLPSISRISGIIRSSQPAPAPTSQPPPTITTLKSVGGLPEADTEEVRIELTSLPRGADLTSRTQNHWSASQSVDRRFQRRSRIALAALAAVVTALGGTYWLLRGAPRAQAVDPAVAAAAAVVKPDPANSPSPVPRVSPGSAAVPSEPSAVPVAGDAPSADRPQVSPQHALQAKTTRPRSAPPAPAAAQNAAPLPPVGSAPAPRRPSDPLEGRH
jgi:hypothetical protein